MPVIDHIWVAMPTIYHLSDTICKDVVVILVFSNAKFFSYNVNHVLITVITILENYNPTVIQINIHGHHRWEFGIHVLLKSYNLQYYN